MYLFNNAQEYFNQYNLTEQWFQVVSSEQIKLLIDYEKNDLNLRDKYGKKIYKSADCHQIMVYLNQKYRNAIKKEKDSRKDLKKKKGLIKVNKLKMQDKECNICFEIPEFKNLVVTNCNHYFCRLCYDNWTVNLINSNKLNITCPCCRFNNPSLKQFTQK